MATRRMFSKNIVRSDAFLDLPISAQALYFHIGMEADDRGYVNNPRSVARSIGAKVEDLEELANKKFILVRDNSLVLIKGWQMNNRIPPTRLVETRFKSDLLKLYYDENYSYTENKTGYKVVPINVGEEPLSGGVIDIQNDYETPTECIQSVCEMPTKGEQSDNKVSPQYSKGKNSKEKTSISKNSIEEKSEDKDSIDKNSLEESLKKKKKNDFNEDHKTFSLSLFEKLKERKYVATEEELARKEEYISLFESLCKSYTEKNITISLLYFLVQVCLLKSNGFCKELGDFDEELFRIKDTIRDKVAYLKRSLLNSCEVFKDGYNYKEIEKLKNKKTKERIYKAVELYDEMMGNTESTITVSYNPHGRKALAWDLDDLEEEADFARIKLPDIEPW